MSTPMTTPSHSPANSRHRNHRHVTDILAETVARFPAWRQRSAFMAAAAARPTGDTTRLTRDCAEIHAEVLAARTHILAELADTPPELAGHSRVVDVERALDSVDAAVTEVERRLGH
jgi:hypothetical protein